MLFRSEVGSVAAGYIGTYFVLRFLMAWTVGVWGLKDPVLRRKLWLLPLRDASAFLVWLASFASNRIQWRGLEFTIQEGRLIPVTPTRSLQPTAIEVPATTRRGG